MNKKIIAVFTGIISVSSSILSGGSVFAYKSEKSYKDNKAYADSKSSSQTLGIFGKVTAIDDDILTVTVSASGITYTVDASDAIITINGVVSSVDSISIGNMIRVLGEIDNAEIEATSIFSQSIKGDKSYAENKSNSTKTPTSYKDTKSYKSGKTYSDNKSSKSDKAYSDNKSFAQTLGVFGKVTAIDGNILTLKTNISGIIYNIDASNATVTINGTTSTIAGITVGDLIRAQGSLNETYLTASTIKTKK